MICNDNNNTTEVKQLVPSKRNNDYSDRGVILRTDAVPICIVYIGIVILYTMSKFGFLILAYSGGHKPCKILAPS